MYIILLHYKILHFADSLSHKLSQALAIASELAISLRGWSNIGMQIVFKCKCDANAVQMQYSPYFISIISLFFNFKYCIFFVVLFFK